MATDSTNSTVQTNNMVCSPAVMKSNVLSTRWGKKIEGSCYTDRVLLKIRDEYNKGHPNAKIEETNPVEIRKQLKQVLTSCEKEDCWLKEIKDAVLRKQLDRFIFAPDQPQEWSKNPNEWLSNFDILGVLEQYETAYPEFEFIGPTPIDFDTKIRGKCVEKELCKIDVPKLIRSGKTKIGVVFNLDKHNEPGSHWVSLFIDTIDRFIFYFDSANNNTPPEINTLIRRIQSQLSEEKRSRKRDQREYSFYRNKITHQHNNTECGVYSLFFIVTMLTKNTEIKMNMGLRERLDLFLKHRIPDKFMETYRNKYFNGGADANVQNGSIANYATGGAFYWDARREIQLFTKAEENGILKETLNYFNQKPNLLEILSLPGAVKRYMNNKRNPNPNSNSNPNSNPNPKSILTPDIFKYIINSNGEMEKSSVLTEREMKLYIFPLLIQMEQILGDDIQNEKDENVKNKIQDYYVFVIDLIRSVSNIINPMWYDSITALTNLIHLPGISYVKSKMEGLANMATSTSNPSTDKNISFKTSWYRSLNNDKYAEDTENMDNITYTPLYSTQYSGFDNVEQMNDVLNRLYYLGDKEQMPVAQQTGKHTMKRNIKKLPYAKAKRGLLNLASKVKKYGLTNKK